MNKYNLCPLSKNTIVKPFGLYNSGIICYFNSAFQCLFSCSSFVDYVMNSPYNNDMLESIKILLDKHKGDENNKSLDLGLFNLFMSKIKRKNKEHSNFGFNHEDVCELLTLLLEVINDDYVSSLFLHKYKCNLFCLDCRKSKEVKEDIGFIFSVSIRDVNHNFIKSNIQSTESNLTKYIRNNYSHCSGVNCGHCGSDKIIKTNRLLNVPTIILISFDKYESKYLYNYPSSINFINSVKEKNKHMFSIVSTIHHNGNKNFGHYYAKCKRGDEWYNCNDMGISSDISILPEQNVYVIAYHYLDTIEYF